ncbi:hypothetical protein [Specibacter cremeus]|uniref:hypothetical protein n=1 Tax=Specibacter cremeus TaxID=1629051 RepID=UPI000F771446|nr:hypothetical protein [Specibacter cremeus]
MLVPQLGGAIKRPWTATIAVSAWLGIITAGILLSLYALTVLAPVSLYGEQAFWTVAGTAVIGIYLVLIATGTAMVLRGFRAGLILVSTLAVLTILASVPNLPQLAHLAWDPSVPDGVTGGGAAALNWQALNQFMFIQGGMLFVLFPAIGAVFAWLPPTRLWMSLRRQAIRAARTDHR